MQAKHTTIGYIFNPETIYEITIDTKKKFYIKNLKKPQEEQECKNFAKLMKAIALLDQQNNHNKCYILNSDYKPEQYNEDSINELIARHREDLPLPIVERMNKFYDIIKSQQEPEISAEEYKQGYTKDGFKVTQNSKDLFNSVASQAQLMRSMFELGFNAGFNASMAQQDDDDNVKWTKTVHHSNNSQGQNSNSR
jgi:hypothetical protein